MSSFFDWYIWPLKPPAPTGQWETITHPQYDFSVDYPTEWTVQAFGEYGFKGAKDFKLRIYQNTFLGLEMFEIEVWYRVVANPTLDDVISWGDLQIARKNHNLREMDKEQYEEIEMQPDSINDYPVVQRIFGNDSIMYEDTYIARDNDMIIIRYQNEANHFEDNLADVERVIQSFRPLK